MHRGILKALFVVAATCTVLLAFAVTGEMMLRWARAPEGMARLKLQMVASADPVGHIQTRSAGGRPASEVVFPRAATSGALRPSAPKPAAPTVVASTPTAPPPAPATPAAPVPDPAPSPSDLGKPATEIGKPTDPAAPDLATGATRPAGPFDAVAGAPATPAPGQMSYADLPPPTAVLPSAPAAAPADPVASASGGSASAGSLSAVAPPAVTPADPPAHVASLDPGALSEPTSTPTASEAKPNDAAIVAPPRTSKRATFKAAMADPSGPDQAGQSLRILQIGDSHTAADFFTGEVRQRLQAIYGDGGAGYLVVGRPHPGVRSEILKMAASPGWGYSAIQRTDDASQFHLSGFTASASKPGETLTLSTGAPISFDSIDLQVKHGPQSGAVELRFDNDQAVKFDLSGPKQEWWFLRATSQQNHVEQLRQLSITTLDSRPVDVASVAIFNEAYGVSYSALGFPGATIDIVNKFPTEFFTEDLQRIDPQIVVLSFGTNEGFNDALDVAKYGEHYQQAINRIKEAVPNAEIVIVAPPNGNRLPHQCKGAPDLTCRPGSDPAPTCAWQTPPKLDRVREMQKILARQDHIHYWNWADVMPAVCGAHTWVNASPRLMQPDHVHFTSDGYRIGADKFSEFLLTLIEKLRLSDRVISNN